VNTLPKDAVVIAHRGTPDILLIKVGVADGHDLGVIWRRGIGISDPMYVGAIAKFGYWETYEGSQGVLAEIEKELKDGHAKASPDPDRGASGDRGARPRRRKRA
jgi:hypothetical protein